MLKGMRKSSRTQSKSVGTSNIAPRGSMSADGRSNPNGASRPEDGVVLLAEPFIETLGSTASTIWCCRPVESGNSQSLEEMNL